MPNLSRILPVAIIFLVTGCSFLDNPTADDAVETLTRRAGNLGYRDVKVSNCKGDESDKTCVVSYERGSGSQQFYEELTMEFVKTPSGWTSDRFRVLKTENL